MLKEGLAFKVYLKKFWIFFHSSFYINKIMVCHSIKRMKGD